MGDCNTKLMAALLGGRSVDEVFREEIETAVNSILEIELTAFLGYEKNAVDGYNTGNSRNGGYTRRVQTRFGEINVRIPRDRNGEFEQKLLPSYKRYSDSLETTVIHLYEKGITTAEIASLIEKMYGSHYTKGQVSHIAESLQSKVREFHSRKLDKRYAVIYADATFLNVRRDCVDKEALHVLVGITPDGRKEVLSYALYPTESAENYSEMLADIKARGVEQVLLFVSDGVIGFREVCKEIYPEADHQSCWVHICRAIMRNIRPRDRKTVLGDLKAVYTADTKEEAECKLEIFRSKYAKLYPKVVEKMSDTRSLFSFYAYPQEIRSSIYTTNPIENMNKQLKRITKRKEQFPNEASLDRCAFCYYSDVNGRLAHRTHRGFDQCRFALERMFDAKYSPAPSIRAISYRELDKSKTSGCGLHVIDN